MTPYFAIRVARHSDGQQRALFGNLASVCWCNVLPNCWPGYRHISTVVSLLTQAALTLPNIIPCFITESIVMFSED
jgi:hypothetical protein